MNASEIIEFLDQLSDMKDSFISSLPIIPNTKGMYSAQYCINKGLYGSSFPHHHGKVVVIRVYKHNDSINIYFFDNQNRRLADYTPSLLGLKIKSKNELIDIINNYYIPYLTNDKSSVNMFIRIVNNLAIDKS